MLERIICWLIEKLGMGRQKWESTLHPLWVGLGMPIEEECFAEAHKKIEKDSQSPEKRRKTMKNRDPHELDCPKCGSENTVLWLKKPKLHCHSCDHDFEDPWKDTRHNTHISTSTPTPN